MVCKAFRFSVHISKVFIFIDKRCPRNEKEVIGRETWMKVAPHIIKKLVSFLAGTGHPLQHPEVASVQGHSAELGGPGKVAVPRKGHKGWSECNLGVMQQQQVASYLLNTVLRAHFDTCPTFAGIQLMSHIHHWDVLHRTPYSKKTKRRLLVRGTSDFSHKKEKKGRKKRHF